MKYNIEILRKICNIGTYQLLDTLEQLVSVHGKVTRTQDYLYIDNGSPVLAIAHLDTVMDMPAYAVSSKGSNTPLKPVSVIDNKINTIQLDDRLGVWLITSVLPQIGIVPDMLFTLDEEVGASTAALFKTDKKYNWMFQFDRRGFGTVVMYQYETPKYVNMLEDIGYDVQIGTISDISYLDGLGCTGFNFGCGYIDEHSHSCMTRISWINVVVEMFAEFYARYKDTLMPYIHKPKVYSNKYNYSYTTPTIHIPSTNGRCAYCDVFLLPTEKTVCSICLEEMNDDEHMDKDDVPVDKDSGNSTCSSCGVMMSEEDIKEGYRLCYDCFNTLRSEYY